MRLLLLADTHLVPHDRAARGRGDPRHPRGARDLPAAVWAEVERADVVVHAGDWVTADLLDALEARARRVVGVWGNNDGPDLRARLPEVAVEELGGIRVGVVHETGAAAGRESRMDRLYAGRVDVLVFGHSHIPWDTVTPGGIRLLNPGSPTDRRRQPVATYLTAEAAGGALLDVRLHPVPRG